jgi:hypothetical protein
LGNLITSSTVPGALLKVERVTSAISLTPAFVILASLRKGKGIPYLT